jgi:hypothetical protein
MRPGKATLIARVLCRPGILGLVGLFTRPCVRPTPVRQARGPDSPLGFSVAPTSPPLLPPCNNSGVLRVLLFSTGRTQCKAIPLAIKLRRVWAGFLGDFETTASQASSRLGRYDSGVDRMADVVSGFIRNSRVAFSCAINARC